MTPSVPDFSSTRVLIAGDVILDRYWHGSTDRISREAPVPVVRVRDVEHRPGGAANVAANVAALGTIPVLLGVTGDDDAAGSLEALLQAGGVDFRALRIPGRATVTKMRVMSRHQQLMRMDFDAGFEDCDLHPLLDACGGALSDADVLILSDYGHGALAAVADFIALARARGKRVVVDPRGDSFARYRGASLITPNLSEFETVVGACRDLDELAARGGALCRELGLEALLVTRSDQGMSLVHPTGEALHVPARAREVYDVTGAGDTVIAVLAAALAAGASLPEAMALSNVAAGIVVGKLGTATAGAAELRDALAEADRRGRGVLDEARLLSVTAAARARGERIVMTNGCFDILHPGHVSCLNRARALGDRLVVAVNDDASVQRLKGHGRPVNTLEHRMAVLEALACVDWVVPFSEDTPERLICAVGPDVLVKGGDYRGREIPGAQCVHARGGTVQILEFVEGFSTSEIIEALSRGAGGRGPA